MRNVPSEIAVLVAALSGVERSAAGTYTLTAGPTPAPPGRTLTVSWSAPISETSPSDWIALYPVGADNFNHLAWSYTYGEPTGQLQFAAPLSDGVYEFRYLVQNGYTHVAVSNPVSVLCQSALEPTGLKVLILGGEHRPSDCGAVWALEESGFRTTLGVPTPVWDGTQDDLHDFDVVVIFHNGNYWRPMQEAGIEALVDYCLEGGGIVTGEWTMWSAYGRQATLTSAAPLAEYCGFNYQSTTTYTLVTPDPIIDGGVPPSFEVSLANFAGTESCFEARPEATVFFSSSNGGGTPNAAGLLGWNLGRGRWASFSTLVSQRELENEHYRRLFANTVAWAAQSSCDAQPATPASLPTFIECLTGPNVGVDVGCALQDLDCNGRVDLRDVAFFQRTFNAP